MISQKLINIRKPLFSRLVVILTLFIFLVVSSTGCVSIQHTTSTIDTSIEKPSISLSMYLKETEQDAEQSDLFHGVSSKLSFQNTDGKFIPVTASERGNWLLKNAMVGKYKFEIEDNTIMIDGKVNDLQGSRSKTFSLKPDQRAQIKVVLKKTPVGLIIVIVVLIIFVIIWYIILESNSPKLPIIPLPPVPGLTVPLLPKAVPLPLPLLLPAFFLHGPVPIFIDGGFYIGPSYHAPDHYNDHGEITRGQQLAPEAIRFFPTMDSADATVSSVIYVSFSKPIYETSYKDLTVINVMGSRSGPIHGAITYVPKDNRLEFLADHLFVPGETITVNLIGQLIKDEAGQSMPFDYEWSFTIAD